MNKTSFIKAVENELRPRFTVVRKIDADRASHVMRLSEKRNIVFAEALYIYCYGEHTGCSECGASCSFVNFRRGYTERCSRTCSDASSTIVAKRKKTCEARYGGVAPACSERVRRKAERTNFEKFGVANAFQSETIKAKIRDTMMEKHGVANPSQSAIIVKQRCKTNQKRYGGPAPMCSKETQEKARETCRSVYGVDHFMQDPAVFYRNKMGRYRIKTVRVGGKKFKVQGWEYHGLRYVHRTLGIPVDQISVESEWFDYRFKNAKRRYFPDICVASGKVFEVKSTMSLGMSSPDLFRQNKRKAKAVERAGKQFCMLLVLRNKRVIEFPNFSQMTRADVQRAISEVQ